MSLTLPPPWTRTRALVTEIELNADSGYAAARKLITDRKRPKALISTGDRTSLGSLKALRELKLLVPRDVAALAVDGTRESAFADPPLTAVEIPWYDMLAIGGRLLIDLIEQRSPIGQIAFITRRASSCASPRLRSPAYRWGMAGKRNFKTARSRQR
jgi:DNA-binding LacI/PurR family transcriptional regulator